MNPTLILPACLGSLIVTSANDLKATGIRDFLGSDRQSPSFSPDGKSVATVFGSPAELVVATLGSQSVAGHELPEGWTPDGVVWIQEKLLVSASRSVTAARGNKNKRECLYWLFDQRTGSFSKTQLEPHIVLDPFLGTHLEKTCLYVPDMASKSTKKLEWPSLDEIGTLTFEAASLGDGWMMRERARDERLFRTLLAVEVCDDDGSKVGSIPANEIAEAAFGGEARFPASGVLSRDHRQILLGFSTETIFRRHSHEYTFGVFEVETGKLLWKGSSNWLLGTPALVGERIYSLEAEEREIHTGDRGFGPGALQTGRRSAPTSDVVLSSFTGDARDVVVKLPLEKPDLANKYGVSKDRDKFVLLVEGPNPRLLVVPIRRDVKRDEVREVPLKMR